LFSISFTTCSFIFARYKWLVGVIKFYNLAFEYFITALMVLPTQFLKCFYAHFLNEEIIFPKSLQFIVKKGIVSSAKGNWK